MKVIFLALLFLCMNLSFGLLSSTGLLDVSMTYQDEVLDEYSGWYQSLPPYTKPLSDEKEFVSEDSESQDRGTGFFDIAMRSLIPTVLLTDTFGIDPGVALLFTIPIYALYAVALAQVFRLLPGGKSAI